MDEPLRADNPAGDPMADGPALGDLPIREVRAAVLDWYRRLGRPLVFRRTTDPYLVLVLEVMAQQTQVARAAGHWESFVERFPSFEVLAAAKPAEVVAAWRGLGYNRRALMLHRTARIVVADHGGHLPSEIAVLEHLPGIGPYTARAVAATAFGQPIGAVDTNVRRVLGRVLGGTTSPEPRRVQSAADELVPAEDPAGWTHALMDLGATICTPRKPSCVACPLSTWCRFFVEVPATRAAPPRSAKAPPRSAAIEPSSVATRPQPAPAFSSTSRWLRGRIVDRLRDAAGSGSGWATFDDPIGAHQVESIAIALDALARDGLAELRPGARLEARLPEG